MFPHLRPLFPLEYTMRLEEYLEMGGHKEVDSETGRGAERRSSGNRGGTFDERIEVLPNGTVLFEYGPMRMFIQASDHGKALVELAKEGATKAREVLEDLARFLPVIKRKAQELEM